MTFLAALIAAAAAVFGFRKSRAFVQRRLAYVDAVHRSYAPALAGLVAGVAALPVVALLPVVGSGTALLFGASVGLGVAAGARAARRRIAAWGAAT